MAKDSNFFSISLLLLSISYLLQEITDTVIYPVFAFPG